MTFEKLLCEARKVHCKEMRVSNDDYFEVVVAKADLGAMGAILQEYFGQPYKAGGVQPSPEAKRYAAVHGGIYTGQTMYFKQESGAKAFAYFWPWTGGTPITVKIIRQEAPAQQ